MDSPFRESGFPARGNRRGSWAHDWNSPDDEVTLMETDQFAEILLRLRKDAGRTQEEQAAAINAVSGRDTMTRREINRYEHGENIPTNHTLAHIAVACGLPPEHLQREAAAARARRRKGTRPEGEDLDDVKRRTLLGGVAVGAAAATEPWERLAHALSRGKEIGSEASGSLVDRACDLHVREGT